MARDRSLRSFFRKSQQDQGETAALADSAPPSEGFGDITDGTSNTLVVGERPAVVEPPTEEFDEADALFGRRTELSDSEPTTAADPEPQPEDVDFVPHEPVPVGPIPVPYPNTGSSGEEQESQQVVQPEFGRGAPNQEVEPANSSPVLENSLAADPVLEDFHDPVGDALDDPFETARPDHGAFLEDDAGIESDIEEPTGDFDFDVDVG